MTNFPFFRALTKTHKLSQSKDDILRKMISGIKAGQACDLYQINLKRNHHVFLNIFHISGSIIWTFAFAVFFEELLLLFMVISYIFKNSSYKKFWNCYYLFSFTPGLRKISGYLIEK